MMLVGNAVVVIAGAVILTAGLVFALRIIGILRGFDMARPWIVLATLISFFFVGYLLTALKFLGIELLPNLTLEGLVTAVFFFGAVFVLVLAKLNRDLFANIFGIGITDAGAIQLLADHVRKPVGEVHSLLKPEYSVTCDVCSQSVRYSMPDVVRAHPKLDRGVVVEQAMGSENYLLYVRHYCDKEYREIPVRHDSQFEYRSQRPSRPV